MLSNVPLLKKRFLIAAATLVMGMTINSTAREYSFGYTGMPDDYFETMRSFNTNQYRADTYPSKFNWNEKGMVTKAKDQGNCGSCWAFATAGVIESRLLMEGAGNYDISEQQLISYGSGSCDGGSTGGFKLLEKVGPRTEADMPYEASSDITYADYLKMEELPYRSTGYYTVNTGNINDVKAALQEDGPAFFGYMVYSDFTDYWRNGKSGEVYKNRVLNATKLGGHAVLVIGWDDTKQAWLCKNSWGETEGPNGDGTFWIAYNGHSNALNFAVFSTTIKKPAQIFKGNFNNGDTKNSEEFVILDQAALTAYKNLGYMCTDESGQVGTSLNGWKLGDDHWLEGTGDFNGDGYDDIVIRSDWGLGILSVRRNSGFDVLAGKQHDTYFGSWRLGVNDKILGIGDFDGNGRDEMLVQSKWGIGIIGVSGSNFTSSVCKPYGTPFGYWSSGKDDIIEGIGDFDGNGRDDVLIRSSWGIGMLKQDGNSFKAFMLKEYGTRFGGWYFDKKDIIEGIGDFDGNNTDDILISSSWGVGMLTRSDWTLTSTMLKPYGTRFGYWYTGVNDDIMSIGDIDGLPGDEIMVRSTWGLGIWKKSGSSCTSLLCIENGTRINTTAWGNLNTLEQEVPLVLRWDDDNQKEFILGNAKNIIMVEKESHGIENRGTLTHK